MGKFSFSGWLGFGALIVLALVPVWLLRPASTGMLGRNTWSTSSELTTVTLKVEASPAPSAYDLKGAYTITFRTSKAHIVGITNAGSLRGERAVAFRFWSKSFDPVMPDYVEYAKLCPKSSAEGGVPCKGSRYDQRLAAGERDIRFEVWNGVDFKAEIDAYVRAIREPGLFPNCQVEYVEQIGMLVLAAPKSSWPDPRDEGAMLALRSAKGCSHAPGRARNSSIGEYEPYYTPGTFAVRFEPDPRDPSGDVSATVNGSALPSVGVSDGQPASVSMSVRYGPWKVLTWVKSKERKHWVEDSRAIQEFLRRIVVSTAGSEK